jgi:KUP system potassium uptake protein
MTSGAKAALCLGALGVVFGDIGTSPLYTMKECMTHLPAGVGPEAGVLGVLSLMFWSLFMVVSVKYIWYVMSADNHGEGGIFALLALLAAEREKAHKRGLGPVVILILVGAALLYGDGIITPAISVLGAAEGFMAINPERFTPTVVVWIACVILAGLFWVQHKGTKRIGSVFGPVMLVWFATLAALGLWHIAGFPGVGRALNPAWGLALLRHSPLEVSALLGAVVLTITGAEALYADMGHFGRRFIAIGWYGAAFPALVLNYFGQGAYILTHPGSTENPFFAMAPHGLPLALLTGLSILAAIIASQALISGAYSLTRQAIQLGYCPRLTITHTNAELSGQIYLPFVNTLLALGCILTVVFFGSTDHLAAAYGIAVTGTMAITTIAYYFVARSRWQTLRWMAGPVCAVFLTMDLAFFGANADKITKGGWFPLAIGAAVLAVMHTWKLGRSEVFERVYHQNLTEDELLKITGSRRITRVTGTAVFMAGSPTGTPVALLHQVKANRCLHETVLLLSIVTEEVPTVPDERRLALREIGGGIWRAVGTYGYMESPDVSVLMLRINQAGVPVRLAGAIYFFNREMILTGGGARMWEWEKRLYAVLIRNARPAKDYYHIPPSQIIELGLPLQL